MPTRKAQATRSGLVGTTKPPASAGLPAYNTEYQEEGNSQNRESSDNSPSSSGTSGLREPPLKRTRVSRHTPSPQEETLRAKLAKATGGRAAKKKANSRRNQSDPKNSTRKTTKVKTKPTSAQCKETKIKEVYGVKGEGEVYGVNGEGEGSAEHAVDNPADGFGN
ncbi:hypothetical protein PHYSODRAFT_303477 [Phytophthora sojae]|uniref:Uncharacterized protein n=1 Tax=Phytophthora sojae (strain P6497) TaxID=1094619 RepID=G4ZR42_PHYSP|nr:hypothetical protein PHYSODRAFT_303477 [Phytophthora sojae]EGZ14264.1 hypothetical protein PHYSODRAFT_303477 [Phytophthora sojae]|eukprot:XP_009531693.1 hypothetical protein PHYSODRAFT_303477 [Phytophthora sojae]